MGAPIEPDFSTFARLYDEGMPQVAWTRLVADLETPVSAMLKLAHERPNSFLLESVEGGATRGRYSIIGCEPDLIWRANGARAEINRAPQADPTAFAPSPLPALASLRALLAEVGDRAAAGAAADGRRHLRLYGLRHGAADRASAERQAGLASAFPTASWCGRR